MIKICDGILIKGILTEPLRSIFQGLIRAMENYSWCSKCYRGTSSLIWSWYVWRRKIQVSTGKRTRKKKKHLLKSYVRITEHRHLFCSVDILWVSQIFFSDYELIPCFRNLILFPKKQNSWCWLCPKSCLWLLSELMETRAEFWVIPLCEVLRFLAVKGSPATWVRPLQSEWWLLRGPGFVCERRSSDSFL